jgi:hypothetical protein
VKYYSLCKQNLAFINNFLAFLDPNIYIASYGDIAQLGERKAGSLEVRGSIPLVSTSQLEMTNE